MFDELPEVVTEGRVGWAEGGNENYLWKQVKSAHFLNFENLDNYAIFIETKTIIKSIFFSSFQICFYNKSRKLERYQAGKDNKTML